MERPERLAKAKTFLGKQSGKIEAVSFSSMDWLDEVYRERVAALWRAMYATRCVREDNVPCKIEEVNKYVTVYCLVFIYLNFDFLLLLLTCFLLQFIPMDLIRL